MKNLAHLVSLRYNEYQEHSKVKTAVFYEKEMKIVMIMFGDPFIHILKNILGL